VHERDDMNEAFPERLSLVERAARRLEAEQEAEAAEASQVLRPPFQAPGSPPPGGSDSVSRQVVIDLDVLASQGYLTPNRMQVRLAQEIRVIKRSLVNNFQSREVPRPNLIMVTSSNPREGKSFMAMNLAISLACEVDYHVLLVDSDFMRPVVFQRLNLTPAAGLMDWLRDPDLDVADIMMRTNIGRLSLIGPGKKHDLSTELLASQRMAQLSDELAERYPDRLIIFDAPPMLACTEPSVLAEHMGQVVFVVEADKTPKVSVRKALSMLPRTCWTGLVLNKGRARGVTDYYDDYGYRY